MASASGFGYDPVGNRTTRSLTDPLLTATETYGYDVFSNRLLSSTSTSGESRAVTHGDSGNRDADTVTGGLVNKAFTMTYDATDRLVEVSNAGVPLGSYLHNALGQRASKTVGGVTTHYLYDLSGRLIAEADGATGAVAAEYIAFEGINLAFITTGSIYWVHGDHLGTPQMLTDAAGAVAWSALYSPFGAVEESGALAFNPRFPGQYQDRETGYYYNYFRTYDPASGRYVESDPIGLRGGWNIYGYVGGNPVTRIDPNGDAWQIILKEAGKRLPPLFCKRYPRICLSIAVCFKNPASCKAKFCRAGNRLYTPMCNNPGCQPCDSCPVLAVKLSLAEGCYVNRLAVTLFCNKKTDPEHERQRAIAWEKGQKCLVQIAGRCAGYAGKI